MEKVGETGRQGIVGLCSGSCMLVNSPDKRASYVGYDIQQRLFIEFSREESGLASRYSFLISKWTPTDFFANLPFGNVAYFAEFSRISLFHSSHEL